MKEPKTLAEAIKYFSDPDICLDFVAKLRWPQGVTCPTCGSTDVRFIKTRRIWECKAQHTKRQFSVKVGTIFEDSAIGLDKWLTAIWMIANDKNGISSYEVARALGITQKSAWFMLHRIRLAMGIEPDKFSGTVEVDETYIGGKARFMHKGKREQLTGTGGSDKVAVMGLLQRHSSKGKSKVQTKVVKNIRRNSLAPEVRQRVDTGSEVFTDSLRSYNDLSQDYAHQAIDHAESYVKGRVHTNGLENFWSLLKRAIRGTYVNVDSFHLFRYLDEESFRFNTRETDDASRFQSVVNGITGKRLTYNQLIGASTTPV
jgi:transposase-like protein